ncbi:hypothetical protein [Sanguibacter sp. HDW7]|uniref:hypothetical protein n=1 Tax=Sanguibacter sp. HDW7 TaxID=2714931 RepID=UPI00140C96A3|nr:hypothetical protein [Sanguibacter sp. HDW7]QIK84253.1 hypothetical protein G7063_11975 [Sanguibacter sp. HDW7]
MSEQSSEQPSADRPQGDVADAQEGAEGANEAAVGATPRRRHRRVVRQGTESGVVAGTSVDERQEGWSEKGTSSHDADLLRDLPPHWGGAGYRD